jgi:hypothetical protein
LLTDTTPAARSDIERRVEARASALPQPLSRGKAPVGGGMSAGDVPINLLWPRTSRLSARIRVVVDELLALPDQVHAI